MKAKYQKGKKSVYQYLRMTSIVNPHASITLVVRNKEGEIVEEGQWLRTTDKLPRVVEEIKPHPHGIHLGTLQRMMREAKDRRMTSFLNNNFSGVTRRAAKQILEVAEIEETRTPKRIKAEEAQEARGGPRRPRWPRRQRPARRPRRRIQRFGDARLRGRAGSKVDLSLIHI